jgi:hypothetical protein
MYDGSIYCCCSYGSAAGMQPTVRSIGCIIDPAATCLQTAVAARMAAMICCCLLQPISYYSSLLLPLLVLLAANSSAYNRQHPRLLLRCLQTAGCAYYGLSAIAASYCRSYYCWQQTLRPTSPTPPPLPTVCRMSLLWSISYYSSLLLPLLLANSSAYNRQHPRLLLRCLQTAGCAYYCLSAIAASYCTLTYYCWQPTVRPTTGSSPDSSSAAYRLQDEPTMVYQLWQPPTAAPTGQLFGLQAASLTLRLLPAFRLQ